MKNNKNKAEKGNLIKRGSISVIYTIVFIALVIALNLVVSSVAGSIDLNVDLTAEGFISIGEVSRNVLGGLKEDGDLEATIYLLADRDQYDSSATNINGLNPLSLIRDLCEEYEDEYRGNIKVEYKNLNLDPEWATEYNVLTNTTLTTNHVIIEGKYHARVVTLDSFFVVDSESKMYVAFNGELRLTTALLQSCISEPQVVTFTTGHGEPKQMQDGRVVTALSDMLVDAGFEVVETDLSKADIDARTKILIVNDPVKDFTDTEIEKLMDYTDTFNSLVVLVDDSTPELPNLSDYLGEEWGLGYKAYHQITSGTNFNNNPLSLSAQYIYDAENAQNSAGSTILGSLVTKGIKTIMPNSVELFSKSISTRDDYTVETLLTSDKDAKSTYTKGGESTTGTFPIMLLSADAEYVNLDDENSTNQVMKYQYVMLAGSTAFAETGSLDSAQFGNGTLMLSAIRTMGVERYSLDIDYKTINDVALSIETQTATRIAIIICAVLPSIIVIAGLVVFVRRRHL